MKKYFLLIAIGFFGLFDLSAQGVGVGVTSPDSSAILEVESNTKGVLLPRLSTAERNSLVNPAQGLLVYDTDKNVFFFYDGYQWIPMMISRNPDNFPLVPIGIVEDAEENDHVGYSIDIDGDYAILGAPFDDIDSDTNQGSAYIFKRVNGNWLPQDNIIVNQGIDDDQFGWSVGISGDYAIVGSPYNNIGGADKGSAFIFHRNGENWVPTARIHAHDGDAGDLFGYSVSIDGDYAAVGAPIADIDGRAYIFYKDSAWINNQSYDTILFPITGAMSGTFGWSIDLDSNQVIVGAPTEELPGQMNRGAAHISVRMGTLWFQNTFLMASDGAAGDNFGWSVTMDGQYAAIGARNDQIDGNAQQGSVYVYKRNGVWVSLQAFQSKLVAPDGEAQDLFGHSVSISGDRLGVGAIWNDVSGFMNAGQGYLFTRMGTTWNFQRYLDDELPEASAQLGHAVCLTGNNILISAPNKVNGKGQIQSLNMD